MCIRDRPTTLISKPTVMVSTPTVMLSTPTAPRPPTDVPPSPAAAAPSQLLGLKRNGVRAGEDDGVTTWDPEESQEAFGCVQVAVAGKETRRQEQLDRLRSRLEGLESGFGKRFLSKRERIALELDVAAQQQRQQVARVEELIPVGEAKLSFGQMVRGELQAALRRSPESSPAGSPRSSPRRERPSTPDGPMGPMGAA
eukprot:TRINITY_DN7888_c0_g2_i24.p1 TRINITY_DN7888_c0_g2~~TRINITY_DN7888_c0_g2_i24.p1  ORF type:complete len:198 (-),score=39.91 TRINITY_DN7888_c0_g2_i24:348-941(-)